VMARNRGGASEKVRLLAAETVDDLLYGELKLIQKKDGHRYSVDALLISDFILPQIKGSHKVMDIGCGAGVISLILAKRSQAKEIVGVEIQKSLARIAKRNVTLNHLGLKIKILNRDVRKLGVVFKPQSFDLIVSNPPFRKVGTGLLSKSRERSIARYEIKLDMPDLLKLCSRVLKAKGSAALIYPFERLNELVSNLEGTELHPRRLRLVFHQKGEPAPMLFCIELSKRKGPLLLDPPYFVETGKGRFHIDRDK
jgi:tRNA1Val (adenine37-N6)-methyltransferase